jgi:hypothetical protein
LLYQLSYALAPPNVIGPFRKLKTMRLKFMRFGLVLCTLALSARASDAQTNNDADRWQVTYDTGQILWDVRLVKLAGDSLQVRRGDSLAVVPVGKITELRLIKKSEMELGAPGGGAMAALMGSDDEVYDLTPLEFSDRLRVVQKIFLYHPPDSAAAQP